MPLKPNGALCGVREQIIEDAPSGLILQFECDHGRLRLVIAGRALPIGTTPASHSAVEFAGSHR